MPCVNHGEKCEGNDQQCKIDPHKDNGMLTAAWGSVAWVFLHCVTFGYPFEIDPTNPEHIEKQNDYYKFFYYLGKVLPCKYCRASYQDFFVERPLVNSLGNRRDICKWLYDIHNKVNDKLGVPECDRPSFEEVQKTYEELRAKCAPTTEAERKYNKAKGCVIPADGKPKKGVVKIVEYSPKDPDPVNPNKPKYPMCSEYVMCHRNLVIGVILVLLSVIGFMGYKLMQKNKK